MPFLLSSSLDNVTNLLPHLNSHLIEDHFLPEFKTASANNELQNYEKLQTATTIDDKKQFICDICNKKFSRKASLLEVCVHNI